MTNNDPWSEDFDYIFGPPFSDIDGTELVERKMDALTQYVEDSGWPERRCIGLVQLTSLIRLEIPRAFAEQLPWDIDSAYIFGQELLDMATHALLGFPISILLQCQGTMLPPLTHNNVYHLLSSPAISLLCDMLGNPLEEILQLMHDGATDQPTALEIAEAAYEEIFLRSTMDFNYPLYANKQVDELVGLAVVDFFESQEKISD